MDTRICYDAGYFVSMYTIQTRAYSQLVSLCALSSRPSRSTIPGSEFHQFTVYDLMEIVGRSPKEPTFSSGALDVQVLIYMEVVREKVDIDLRLALVRRNPVYKRYALLKSC